MNLALFVLLALVVGWGLVTLLGRLGTAEYRKEEKESARIASLPLDEAERHARRYLSDESLFRCVEAKNEAAQPHSVGALPPRLGGILRQYERIETARGEEIVIDRSLVSPSRIKPAFIRIGTSYLRPDVEGELAVRPQGETVFELYPDEEPDPRFGTYSSIFHWVLVVVQRAGHPRSASG